MSSLEMRIDLLGPEDWRDNKALRLEALRLEPAAFSSTYEDAVQQPETWWQERLANPRCTMFMARSEEQPVGMVAACQGEDAPGVGFIFGMYVNALHRRQGVGRALLVTAIDHLTAQAEIFTIRLWVRKTHHPARRLYESLGFRLIDEPGDGGQPGHGPGDELAMERRIRR